MRAWNMMKGIDWNALPIVCEIIGVDDPELMIAQLISIRDSQETGEE